MNNKINQINQIIKTSKKDTQINNKSIFSQFTDFQNIMFSYISLLELLYDNIENKTIKELYLENESETQEINLAYEKIIITEEEMLEMSEHKNLSYYKNIVLSKLIRYGFSDIKIIKQITGKHSFDAFILEDKKQNLLVYFPCTNIIEYEDFIYDAYPIMSNINNSTKLIGNLFGKQIYESQQHQAKELVEKVLNNRQRKVYIAGYSLGGSLAECSFLNSVKKNNNIAGLILFNPYHNDLNKKDVNTIINSKKLKLYVSEGDTVSCIFNYYDFYKISKPVYINYEFNKNKTNEAIKNNQSIINGITMALKNEYIDFLIKKYKNITKQSNKKRNLKAVDKTIDMLVQKLETLKNVKTPVSLFLKNITNIIEKIPGIKQLEESTNYLKFLLNINYIESIFTSTHLTYAADNYKKISFDSKGRVKNKIKFNNKTYNVRYPSFNEVNNKELGNVINILNNYENNVL